METCVFLPLDPMLIESLFVPGELSWGGEDAAFLPVSRERGSQCAFPSASVTGPVENSSRQLTADSVTGLHGPAAMPARLLSPAELPAC